MRLTFYGRQAATTVAITRSPIRARRHLEITQKYMRRVMAKSQDKRLTTRAFHAQANLLTAGL